MDSSETEVVNNQQEEQNNQNQNKEEEKVKSKRNRRRRQKLYADIRKQMEFYFSDANITKNRLMKDIVQKSEYVDLGVFMGFNKISCLTQNVEEVRKAIKHSEKLEISPDKLGVKRKIPYDETKLKDEHTIENCTIYVENIPRNVGHEWIEKIFQEFGTIAYISFPKFKKSGQPKGFAFVEFEEQVGAERCLEAYGSMGACLPTNLDPAELLSVKSFEDDSNSNQYISKPELLDSRNEERNGATTRGKRALSNLEIESDDTKAKKRKSNQEESRKRDSNQIDPVDKESEEPVAKKNKIANIDHQSIKKSNSSVGSTESSSLGSDSTLQASTSTSTSSNLQDNSGPENCKKKKRRKNNKCKNTSWRTITEAKLETESIQLRILPKTSWRKLRNRFLNLQRENMSKLKRQLRLKREQDPDGNSKPTFSKNRSPSPSICVRITLEKPAENVDNFKAQISDLSPKDWSNFLKHIDYTEGEVEAVVRFDGGPHAMMGINIFLQNSQNIFKCHVMTEEESSVFWKSVKTKVKKNNSKFKKPVRGKDRLINEAIKVATHIRFHDEDESKPPVEHPLGGKEDEQQEVAPSTTAQEKV